MPETSESQRPPADRDDVRCSFCRKSPRKVGPLVEGAGPDGAGGVFICEDCAEMIPSIIGEEKKRRTECEPSEDQEEQPKVTVRKPTLSHLQALIHRSVVEDKGVLSRESALVWCGYFASLLEWELLSVEDYKTLLKLLPDYPDDPEVQRILGRGFATPGEA